MSKFTLKVTMEFTQDDVQAILDEVNDLSLNDDSNPITFKEFKKNKTMQKYLIKELQNCNGEIIEGTREAVANDWLCDIEDSRK